MASLPAHPASGADGLLASALGFLKRSIPRMNIHQVRSMTVLMSFSCSETLCSLFDISSKHCCCYIYICHVRLSRATYVKLQTPLSNRLVYHVPGTRYAVRTTRETTHASDDFKAGFLYNGDESVSVLPR